MRKPKIEDFCDILRVNKEVKELINSSTSIREVKELINRSKLVLEFANSKESSKCFWGSVSLARQTAKKEYVEVQRLGNYMIDKLERRLERKVSSGRFDNVFILAQT